MRFSFGTFWDSLSLHFTVITDHHRWSFVECSQEQSISEFLQLRDSALNFVRLLSSAVFPARKLISSNKGVYLGGDDAQAHEADQVSIINRRLKQLYGTLKHPLLPALTYGPGLQAALDHLNYCNNQPSPAGAHYHNARRCYRERRLSLPWKSTPQETTHMKYILTLSGD